MKIVTAVQHKLDVMFLLLTFNITKKKQFHLTDEEIIEQILLKQDSSLIAVLYDRYGNKVYRKCISFVKEAAIAEDLTHDIFIKVYLNLNSFKNKSKFSTWLYSITYNFCIDFLRKNKKENLVAIEDDNGRMIKDVEIESLDEFQQIEPEQLERLLEKVKADEKMILLMKYQEDLTIKDIQSIFNISESAVKMRIKRAKEKIRFLYEQEVNV